MKYNRLFPAYILGLSLLFTSCNKWLDVTPKTQVKEEEQFKTKQGYTDVLFGIYQRAANEGGYGKHLSFGLLDILAQRYENKSITTTQYGALARYNYATPIAYITIDSVFANSYSAIAQANYLLQNVDKGEGVLDETTRMIIKGEALGMRGFLHFDLARLFSDSYNNGAGVGSPSIAYMKAFTVAPQARLSLGQVIDQCELDLKEAETLLAVNQDIDLIELSQGKAANDVFLQFRQNHMNYWAVKATLARLYLYKGDKVNAYKYAMEVINSQKFKFVNPTTLNVDVTSDASDLTFSSEHIFSVYVSRMKVVSDALFKNVAPIGEPNDLWSTRSKLDAAYQSTIPGYGTDIRKPGASKSLWNELSASVVYTKKYWADKSTNVKQRLIPVIKLSEMYYIAAESAGTMSEGITLLNVVRTNRLIPELAVPASQANFDAEILNEYRKEFYGEGQLWFYHKRVNSVTITDGLNNPMTKAKYLLPLPNTELEFGLSN